MFPIRTGPAQTPAEAGDSRDDESVPVRRVAQYLELPLEPRKELGFVHHPLVDSLLDHLPAPALFFFLARVLLQVMWMHLCTSKYNMESKYCQYIA